MPVSSAVRGLHWAPAASSRGVAGLGRSAPVRLGARVLSAPGLTLARRSAGRAPPALAAGSSGGRLCRAGAGGAAATTTPALAGTDAPRAHSGAMAAGLATAANSSGLGACSSGSSSSGFVASSSSISSRRRALRVAAAAAAAAGNGNADSNSNNNADANLTRDIGPSSAAGPPPADVAAAAAAKLAGQQQPGGSASLALNLGHRSRSHLSPDTLAVHGGEAHGRVRPGVPDSLTTPIVQTSTYTFRDTAELIAYQEGTHTSFEYGRYGNPTVRAVEEKLMALEGAEDALLSASGMCSATTMLLSLVPQGGHIVTTTDCYRRTRQFIQTVLPKMGISCTVIDPADLQGLAKALEEHEVSLFFSESPTNPYLRCVDIQRIGQMCGASGCVVCIDSTFATPCNTKALGYGADLVIHSATKYLAGHNDVLAGCIAGRADLVARVRAMHNVLGGVIDPHAAYLLLRGLKTLALRVARQNATAMELAARLERHPAVARVHYPGLASHPDHAIAVRQMPGGYGGVVSFEVAGDLWDTASVIDGVRLPYIAPSLGGVETLIEQPTVISYWDQGPERRAAIGIKDCLVRYSCGVEDPEDLWQDLEQALDGVLVRQKAAAASGGQQQDGGQRQQQQAQAAAAH
jgi:cystathionine gamma-synthase